MTDSDRLVVGVQPVREVLRVHGSAVKRTFVQRDSARLAGLVRLATSVGAPVSEVSRQELDGMCKGAQHQGVAALAPDLALQSWPTILSQRTLCIALDGIVDPQNFGAVVRSAVGVAAAPIVWPESASAPLSLATFRASAGAIEHAELCRVQSLTTALSEAVGEGFEVVGLDGHAEYPLHALNLTGKCVIVVGSEGKGLSKGTRRQCTQFGRLVMPKTVDSLNASVAAALALYEAMRQRSFESDSIPTPG